MSRSAGYDRYISIFSPEGKLFQVEYAIKASKSENITSIAVRGLDSVVVVTEKKVPDKLIDPDTVRHIWKVTPRIGVLLSGIQADCRMVLYRIRQKAADFKLKNGIEVPVDYLAKLVADDFQFFTQHAYARPLASGVILFAIDDERGPQVFKLDPSGIYAGYKATAMGQKELEANSALEKKLRNPELKLGYEETLRLAINTLQSVIAREFQSSELEVCVVRREPGRPELLEPIFLPVVEVDAVLTSIVEGGGFEEYMRQRAERGEEEEA